MPLTDITIRTAKPRDKAYKLYDGGGLFISIQPNGGKWWRYEYRFAGKRKLLALGVYPDVTLAAARDKHSNARKALAEGNDPSEAKKEAKRIIAVNAENNMEAIAREWYAHHLHEWKPHYARDVINRLETHIFPKLGSRPIADIGSTELLSCLKIIEKSGALDMAQRMMQTCGQVYRYAIITGRTRYNPVNDLRGALKTPVRNHHAHLNADELPEFLAKLETYDGEPQTKLALKLLILTFVRTTELRGALWQEVNFDKAEWRIPAERMKMKDPHIVPLSSQSIAILRELQKHSGNREFIFPNQQNPSKCMSENTMLYAIYRLGYHSRTTGHGFRATASTIMNEHGFAPDHIERQLAHCERNKVRAAYNHAQYLPERRKMMQWWGDYLDDIMIKSKKRASHG
jgi:integrase